MEEMLEFSFQRLKAKNTLLLPKHQKIFPKIDIRSAWYSKTFK